MATNTFSSNFSADVSLYIAQKLLMLAMKRLVVYQLCDKAVLPHNNGRTFQYSRYERVALPQSVLTEGVTPGDTSMSVTVVQCVMDQWGAVIPISDVAIDSVKHPVLQKAINLASLQAAEVVDREIIKVLMTGANVYFPNAISSRPNLTTSDKMSSAVVGKVVANMRDVGAVPYDADYYYGVIDSFSEEDLLQDSTFVLAAQYASIKNLMVNEVGAWKGVRWLRSNTLPKIGLLTGASGAGSATAGSLSASTTYNAKLSVVDALTGQERFISATFNAATGAGQSSVDITVPALPSGATASSTFNLYFGSNGGTLYLAASGIAASSTKNQGVVPTSGYVAQPAAPSGINVHFAFIFGMEAVTCVELNKVQTYLTPAVPSDSDPLVQRRKVGWKTDFKTVINNDAFLARIEHYATNG